MSEARPDSGPLSQRMKYLFRSTTPRNDYRSDSQAYENWVDGSWRKKRRRRNLSSSMMKFDQIWLLPVPTRSSFLVTRSYACVKFLFRPIQSDASNAS